MSLKESIKRLGENPVVIILSALSTLFWLKDIIKPFIIYNNMDAIVNYFSVRDWSPTMAIIGFIAIALLEARKSKKERIKLAKVECEVRSIKEAMLIADMEDMEDEIIHAVAWWVGGFNPVESERNAYIEKYFPRNKYRIKDYISHHPFPIQQA